VLGKRARRGAVQVSDVRLGIDAKGGGDLLRTFMQATKEAAT
jgi:hypothetical protein